MNLRSHGPGGGLTIDEYIVMYCFSEMKKGWESNPEKLYLDYGDEGHTFGTRQDCRVGFTPPGLTANDVLRGRVHATYSI